MAGANKVLKNSVIYTISNLILKASNFLLLPLYTAFLTTEDYGVTNIAGSFNNVAAYIVACSLYSAIIRFYSDIKEDTEKVKRMLSTVVLFLLGNSVIMLIIISVFRGVFGKLIFLGIPFFPSVVLIIVAVPFNCVYTVYQDYLKAMQDSVKSAVTGLVYFFTQIGLNIFFVVVMQWGANGILFSNLIVNILGTGWMLIDLMRKKLLCLSIDKPLLKSMLKYSVPLLPHNLSSSIAQLVSKIFINNAGSLSSVGLFGVASQFGSLADTIQVSASTAFEPWFYDEMNASSKDGKKRIIKLSNLLIWIYGFVFIGISLFSQEAVLIMTSSGYSAAWKYVPLTIFVFAIKIPYYFYVNVLYYHKEKTKYIFTATLSTSILNVVLSYFLIKSFGITGSIIADAVAMALRVIIIIALANHVEKIGFNVTGFVSKIAVILVFMAIGVIPSYLYFNSLSLINLLFKTVVIVFYAVLVFIILRRSYKEEISFVLEKFKGKK